VLPEFYRNESLRKEVHEYLVAFLSEKAVEKVFAREDVSAVAEAREMIDAAFDNLSVLFGKHKKKEIVEEAV
jgi:hypothetical protein